LTRWQTKGLKHPAFNVQWVFQLLLAVLAAPIIAARTINRKAARQRFKSSSRGSDQMAEFWVCYLAQPHLTQLHVSHVHVSPLQSSHLQTSQPQPAAACWVLAELQHAPVFKAAGAAAHLQSAQSHTSQLQFTPSQSGHRQSVQPQAWRVFDDDEENPFTAKAKVNKSAATNSASNENFFMARFLEIG
jgi:hypothetical protein